MTRQKITDVAIELMKKENKKYVIEQYSKMNLVTLIYNALILKEELEKREKEMKK